jgi:hypothetical protein
MIDVADMFALLLQVCPDARPAWEEHCRDWPDDDMSYLGVAVFAQHLVGCFRAGRVESLPGAFAAIERLIVDGIPQVRALSTIGLLEDIQNIASWEPFGNRVFRSYLGPASLAAWEEIEEMWRGKSSLMDVVRAESNRGRK